MGEQTEHLRTSIGLTAAAEGNLRALERFLRWAGGELQTLGLFSELPKPVRDRLMMLVREHERTWIFVEGFAEAQPKPDERLKAEAAGSA